MALLAILFLSVLLISFAIVLPMLRVPAAERTMDQRLASVQASTGLDIKQKSSFLKDGATRTTGISEKLSHFALTQRLERLIYQATGSSAIGPTLLATALVALVGMGSVLFITNMAPIAAVAGVLCGSLPVVRLSRLRQRRVRAFENVLPDCIDMCGRALRAGHSLVAAIGMVAEDAAEPAKAEFAEIYRKQSYGLPLQDAFAETMERIPSADLRVFVTGILVQKDTGGNLTEIFDRIVNVIRERRRIHGEIRVHTTQGRLTGWILTLLPLVLLILINLMNPGYSKPLFTEPTGRKLLYVGMGLLLIGGVTIRRIVNGIEV